MNDAGLRNSPAERLYPLTAMTANKTGSVTNVAAYAQANSFRVTGIMIDVDPANTNTGFAYVSLAAAGGNVSQFSRVPLTIGSRHGIDVAQVRDIGTTAGQVFILGIN